MDFGMRNRLSKIIKPETGKTVMLAVNHGYFQGPTTGLRDLRKTITPLIPYADCLFITKIAVTKEKIKWYRFKLVREFAKPELQMAIRKKLYPFQLIQSFHHLSRQGVLVLIDHCQFGTHEEVTCKRLINPERDAFPKAVDHDGERYKQDHSGNQSTY